MEATQSLNTPLSEGKINKTESFDRLKRAAQADPKSERAWLDVANATDDLDEEIQALGQVVALNPGNIEARNRLLSLQVGNLRDGINANERAYQENPLRRFGRPLLLLAGLLTLIAIVLVGKDPAQQWLNDHVLGANVPQSVPTSAALVLPPTWTPVPTLTPTPTAVPSATPVATEKPKIVLGKINGTVRTRSGPGAVFAIVGSLNEPTAVVLVGRSPDSSYFQVHGSGDDTLVWVSADFVTVTQGDPSTLPVVSVPPPTLPPTPKPVYRPPPPTSVPVLVFKQIKYQPNPYGPRCDRTLVQGTVWDVGYGNGYVPGTIVAVWLNGSLYRTDAAGSHPDSFPAHTGNRAYWEVDFATGQPVSGLVGVVSADGRLLSPQYNFTLTGGDCHNPNSINEVIIDFSH